MDLIRLSLRNDNTIRDEKTILIVPKPRPSTPLRELPYSLSGVEGGGCM